MFLTLIYYSQLLFSHQPVMSLIGERLPILHNLLILQWITYHQLSHTIGKNHIKCNSSTFTKFPFQAVCVDLCYSYQFLILYSYCQVSTTRLIYWYFLLSLYPPQIVLLTSALFTLYIGLFADYQRLVLCFIILYNKPLLSHFVLCTFQYGYYQPTNSIPFKISLKGKKIKITSVLHCLVVFHTVY